jgi:hypothetical protein
MGIHPLPKRKSSRTLSGNRPTPLSERWLGSAARTDPCKPFSRLGPIRDYFLPNTVVHGPTDRIAPHQPQYAALRPTVTPIPVYMMSTFGSIECLQLGQTGSGVGLAGMAVH